MTKNRVVMGSLLVVAGAMLMAACGSDDDAGDGAGSTDGAAVEGSVWVLEELSGDAVPDGVTVTLEYDGEMIAGTGGCNRYRSSASFDDGSVTIAPEIVSTMMACPEPESDVEQRYLATLPGASGFEVSGDELRITDGDDAEVLVFRSTDEIPSEITSG